MSMNILMEESNVWKNFLEEADISVGTLSSTGLIVLGIAVLIGVLWCFLGLKLVRIWSAIMGFAIGFGAAWKIASEFALEDRMLLIIGLAAGIILACLGSILYRVGVFIVVFLAGTVLAIQVFTPDSVLWMAICLGIGLVIALLTIIYAEPVTMVVTGVLGALVLGNALCFFIPLEGNLVRIVGTVLFAVLGIWVQFVLESGKRKKQSLKKAEEIREQHSAENEVEKARAMVEELEEEDEEKEEDDITFLDL